MLFHNYLTFAPQNKCFVHINTVDNVDNSVNNSYRLTLPVDNSVVIFKNFTVLC